MPCTRNCCPRCFSASAVWSKPSGRWSRGPGDARAAPAARPPGRGGLPAWRSTAAAVRRGSVAVAAGGSTFALIGVSRGGHARRLLDHDEMLVQVPDADIRFSRTGAASEWGSSLTTSTNRRRWPASTQRLPLSITRRDFKSRRTSDHDFPGSHSRNAAATVWPTCRGRTRKTCPSGSGFALATAELLPP